MTADFCGLRLIFSLLYGQKLTYASTIFALWQFAQKLRKRNCIKYEYFCLTLHE